MLKIAHIVNPVAVPQTSDLYIAQPITFESMKRAKDKVGENVDVQLLTCQYPEDYPVIPDYLSKTSDLDRSILDFGTFLKKRKLPLIRDIVDRLTCNSDADLFIYTNVDIAVQPHFYSSLAELMTDDVDSLLINRRTLVSSYTSVDELDQMYQDDGEDHEGIDCFVFRRKLVKKFFFADSFIGSGPVGLCFAINLTQNSERYIWLENARLTFHIGNDKAWIMPDQKDYVGFNYQQYLRIAENYELRNGNSKSFSDLKKIKKFANDRIYELGSVKKMSLVSRLIHRKCEHPKEMIRERSG